MVNINKRIALRREQQLEQLVLAAEMAVSLHGLAGFKARELANDIGVSLGMIYNLVEDMDDLVLRVAAKTLDKLDTVLNNTKQGLSPQERLIEIALAYRNFASNNTNQWRVLFEYRMPTNRLMPEKLVEQQTYLFRHIVQPLAKLLPKGEDLALTSRMMFSAVHGVIALGLDEKLVAVPLHALDEQLTTLVSIMCAGLNNSSGD